MPSTPIKLIYFGTSSFAVPALRALAAQRDLFEVLLVVSQPDRPVGRQAVITPPPVAAAAKELGLPLYQPAKLRDGEAEKRLKPLSPDVFVVAAYGRILPPDLLAIPKRGALNLHGSILPRHRGASPLQSAILQGDGETGITLMLMDAELDHGPILDTLRVPLVGNETFPQLESRLGEAAAEQIAARLPEYIAGRLPPQEQDHAGASFTGLIEKNHGGIVWSRQSASEIERMIRAYEPWPGVFAVWNRNGRELRLRILRAAVAESTALAPGQVGLGEDGCPTVGTAEGNLRLLELQIEGKNAQAGDAFARGYREFIGSRLGDGR